MNDALGILQGKPIELANQSAINGKVTMIEADGSNASTAIALRRNLSS